ncbi:MAG: putative ribosome biogenesis GTPase RsgA [Spirochaetes bacterium ADurb.Bin218]|nr:MAG: putative ribosome biogenesis GTPase RsgA [Spirochaetes bacterium ADurb.Bin218]
MFVIEKVLERKSIFSRACSGKRSDEQIIVSNIDIIFIVAGLDGGRNFTPRGIERYITMVYNGGALPVILLNKCDLCIAEELEDFIKLTKVVAGNIDIIPVSALTGTGIYRIKQLLMPGITAAFTGPSGVGKSALINSLMEAFVQKTGETRSSDKRGRHTTSHRELFCLPGGGMLIDTPGLRELMPYGDVAFVDMTFSEISKAAFNCRFKNCSHRDEPGCAVLRLVEEGEIAYERYSNYMAMKKEIIENERRKSEKWHLEQKAKDKALSKIVKNYYKEHKQ